MNVTGAHITEGKKSYCLNLWQYIKLLDAISKEKRYLRLECPGT